MAIEKTQQQFEKVMAECRALFVKKLHDYGAAWRILRPSSLTDQIYIKANRIRSIETKGVGLIQLEKGFSEKPDDMTKEEAIDAYDRHANEALQLMLRKNHDYDEAWRGMRISSYTDLILMKVFRTKEIESLGGDTLVSEGVDANYIDMLNYAVFGLIKLTYGEDDPQA